MGRSASRALAEHRSEVLARVRARGFSNPLVFGSVARHEDTETSDVDLVVEPGPGTGLFDMSGLVLDLEDILGCPVDVVSSRSRLSTEALREAVPL